jgi:hypothetical protein
MPSVLNQRFSWASMLGKLFGGTRDLYKTFGYTHTILYRAAWARYRRQDIASRIIDAPVNALWSSPPTVSSGDATWDAAWNDLVINRGLWGAIARADKMAGLGDYSILLLGFENTSKLDLPAGSVPGRKVLYFQPYDYGATLINKIVSDPGNSRYMQPELYHVQPIFDQVRPTAGINVQPFNVHYSRVLHIAENILNDTIFGNPRIERVWNLLDDLLKVCGGTAETFWLTANRGMQIDVDKEMELTPEDEKNLTEEVQDYIDNIQRVIRTRGVKVNNLGSTSPSPQQVFNMIISLMSGATGIPQRILLGSEMGQLASSQDRNNWAERIIERRKNFGEPMVLWPLIRNLTEAGVLPSKAGLNITISWPDAFQLTPLEIAQASTQTGLAANNLTKAMQQKPGIMTVPEARKILGLDPVPTMVESVTLTEDTGI